MTVAMTLIFAVLLDMLWGEPKHGHPLVGFGKLANWAEKILRRLDTGTQPAILSKCLGILGVLALLAPLVILSTLPEKIQVCRIFFNVLILYLCIGASSLVEHARAVSSALLGGNLDSARTAVAKIVSRDTSHMDEEDVARAAIESVLENGSDAIFAAMFWFMVLGAPGVVLYRLSNTLDAMWGYKNSQYLHFGWAAARLDDLLNWIPARLTALTYTLLGNCRLAWHCWQVQGKQWYSPNAGPVMSAGAGALCLQLGGPASYDGQMKERPILGQGSAPTAQDINRATNLVTNGILLWIIIAALGGWWIGA